MKRTLTLLVVSGTLAAVQADPAAAQTDVLDLGVHLARASDIHDGATGIGGQLAVTLPGLPLTVRGAVDRFFPDCPAEVEGDCGAWGFTADANMALPIPVLSPYASAGLVRRSVEVGDPLGDRSETGFAVGAGLHLGLLGLEAFGEMRREIMDQLENQWMFRLGVLF